MRWRLNDTEYELATHRIQNVTELKSRMAQGGLLYWTMLRPAHALLLDPQTGTLAQLAFFKPLWALQRSNQIRQDRHEGIYQVFVTTMPTLEKAASAHAADTQFAQSTLAEREPVTFNPSI